jgi:TIGR03009 family protein
MNELMGQRILVSISLLLGLAVGAHDLIAQTAPLPRTRPAGATPQTRVPQRPAQATRPQSSAQTRPEQRAGSAPQMPLGGGQNPLQPRMPDGFPLSAEEQERVDQILTYWEFHTAKIKTHQCTFWRENYDYVFGKRDVPRTVEKGTIRYSAPDKGLMKVEDMYKVSDPQAEDWRKALEKEELQFGEHWVCDGESIFQYDTQTKTLTQTELPPAMRGQAIADGPLPFLFGAKADKMKERYWIREKKPANNPNGEYFLEAIPKRPEDAANFERIWIQLATEGAYLFPKVMRVYNKQGYVKYTLIDHAPNATQHRIAGFLNSFVSPKTPPGWKKVVEDWNAPPQEAPTPTRQAVNPRSSSRK